MARHATGVRRWVPGFAWRSGHPCDGSMALVPVGTIDPGAQGVHPPEGVAVPDCLGVLVGVPGAIASLRMRPADPVRRIKLRPMSAEAEAVCERRLSAAVRLV